jgi:protein O-mannosyl-transferase
MLKNLGLIIFNKDWKKMLIFSILIFLFASVVYGALLNVGFLSDDWGYVILARDTTVFESLNFFTNPDYLGAGGGNFRPLASVATVVLWKPFLNQPLFLHLIAIFLHSIVALLVGLLTMKLLKNKASFYIASLLFLVLPLNIETIAWLCAAWNGLFSLIFLLLFLIVYLSYNKFNFLKYCLLTLLFFSSILFKEYALLLPAIILLFDLFQKKKVNFTMISYLFILDLVYFGWRSSVIGSLGGYGNHLTFNIPDILKYIEMPFAYIFSFHDLVPSLLSVSFSILLIAAIIYSVYKIVKNEKKALFSVVLLAILIYLGNVLGWNIFDFTNNHIAHNRVLYLSNVFFVLLLYYLIGRLSVKKRLYFVIVYVLLSVVIIQYQMIPWRTAGETTESILEKISVEKIDIPTDELQITNLPDNYQGAFIFRNGIDQAVIFSRKEPYVGKVIIKEYQDQIDQEVLIIKDINQKISK